MLVILELKEYHVLQYKGGFPVSHAIEFIETSMFTRQIKEIATDDELKELQRELIESPDKGDLIRGTGGLRKIRMAIGSQGKNGSARVIYLLATEDIIYLVMAYPKSKKDSLTDAEKAELKKLTKLLKDEV
nr:type II toxin-antitoxin system RelE/ParE family toxin [Photorhabdus aegyptia]